MSVFQTASAAYIIAVFVIGSIRLLGQLWDDEKEVTVHSGPVTSVLLVVTVLVCAITTLGAV